MAHPWEAGSSAATSHNSLNPLSSFPIRVIDEQSKNDILEYQNGQYVVIGHTLKWCTELETAFNEAISLGETHKAEKEKYYARLVELGDIKPKRTTEELLDDAIRIIDVLADKVSKLEARDNGRLLPEVSVKPKTNITETEVSEDEYAGSSNRTNKKSLTDNSKTNK